MPGMIGWAMAHLAHPSKPALQATHAAIQENLSTSTFMFQPSANLSASNIQSSMHLPKLQLPNFDGYILKWPEFWDIYESSVHRQDIPNVMKFSYLKGALRGSAALAITGISVTNEKYDVAKRILRERFGNSQLLKHYMPSCNICQRLQIDLVILNIPMM